MISRPKRVTLGVVLLLAALFSFAGCGDDDSGNSTAAAPTPVVTPDPIDQVPVNETVALPGLGGGTDVVYDEIGIPHIYAPDLASALFVQGYVMAAARFWEMDVFRHFAEGRLTEILGKAALKTDVGMRTVFTTRDGRRVQDALWEHTQQVDPDLARDLEAFTSGINAWLADLRGGRNGVTLPPEYSLQFVIDLTAADLEDWRPQDTLAIGRLQAYLLSETLEEEITRARTKEALADAVFRDVFRSAGATTATVLPVPAKTTVAARSAQLPKLPALPVLAQVSQDLQELRNNSPIGSRDSGVGSNNWIVSPALSANGHAMLANDPHLPLYNPAVWHMVQLNVANADAAPDRVTGVIFPGLPGVILGHNDYGAWGGTTAYFDVTDVYVEDVTTPADYPTSPRTVRFNGHQVPVLRLEEVFKIKGRDPVTEVIEVVPHHGPMVPDPNIGDRIDGLAATGMSFRWTGHEITDDVRFLIGLARARNVNDFRAALQNFAVGGQNWVWADIEGNIAYYAHVLIPQRPKGTIPYLPMPGTGEAEWLTDGEGKTLWLPESKIPQATNPPEGFLATSNSDQIGNTLDNDPLNDDIYLTYAADLGFREERIQELLSNRTGVRPAGAKMTAADMSHYQYDHSSKEAARLLPFLFAAAEARPDLVSADMTSALSRLRAWGEAKVDSPSYDARSGIDAHDLRSDVAPRLAPVSEEERNDAVATSIFGAWETRLCPALLADDFQGTGIAMPTGQDATKALLHILEDVDRSDEGFRVYTKDASGQSSLWDNKSTAQVETRDEILLTALRNGLTFLSSKFASPQPQDWLWGKIHGVLFQHFIGQAGLPGFDLGPFAAPGARYTVNPANYNLNVDNFTFYNGPSERFVAVLDPAGIYSVNALPGGNNGNPGGSGSENFATINPAIHYGDLIHGWINGETFANHISHADVAAHAVTKVRYTP